MSTYSLPLINGRPRTEKKPPLQLTFQFSFCFSNSLLLLLSTTSTFSFPPNPPFMLIVTARHLFFLMLTPSSTPSPLTVSPFKLATSFSLIVNAGIVNACLFLHTLSLLGFIHLLYMYEFQTEEEINLGNPKKHQILFPMVRRARDSNKGDPREQWLHAVGETRFEIELVQSTN